MTFTHKNLLKIRERISNEDNWENLCDADKRERKRDKDEFQNKKMKENSFYSENIL